MSAAVKRLEETGNALRDAMAQQDWTAISVLDVQCRQVVEAAMVEAREDDSTIRQRLQDLVTLYQELVAACQAEKRRVADELIQLNQSQQGANIYKLFG
ncbi:flagellar protein FliT [Stutzerimonas zhaodongensis]|uniref:Flagellar protein FliT n=1 Tax=Stutzerimonas zhaodongensis TaxID=1176257 RepID=A0A3M2HRE5_9GAMM|nr:flagellar protein FliT [Stutzerimonas zhaodongensis]MCQ4314801.1 flagellar protein FliT [Stutzerimonas zhaodongensis]RMH92301.1 flagellar protein FliT [Stutzerimonas zhaodongensis]